MKCCAFTGHRKIESRHQAGISDLLIRSIEYAYCEGCRIFITGGALGFDTIAAKEVIRFKMSHPDVRLHIIVPCRNQSDSWSEAQISVYEYTLANADEIEYITDEYEDGCMRLRNQRMADCCDIMIAYVSRSYSGAAQTARMAEKAGKKVYNIYHALG